MARLRDSWRTSLPASQQPRNPQSESIARTPYEPPATRAPGQPGWRATWPRSDAARGWPKACAADPGAGSCPWGGMSRSAAPVSSSARPLAWLLLIQKGAKCYLGEKVQARTGPSYLEVDFAATPATFYDPHWLDRWCDRLDWFLTPPCQLHVTAYRGCGYIWETDEQYARPLPTLRSP